MASASRQPKIVYSKEDFNDRTVRSVLTIALRPTYISDRTVRSSLEALMLQRNKNGEAQCRLVEKPQDAGTPEPKPANDIGGGDATRATDAKALPIPARATAQSFAPESSPVPNAGVTAKAKGKRKPLL